MSEYIMDPGARLEIGPGGKPYESLGACCAGCASGKKTCGGKRQGLGASFASQVASQFATPTFVISQPSLDAPSSIMPYVAVAGLGILGLIVYLRRRR